MRNNGTAKPVNFEEYIQWYSALSLKDADAVFERFHEPVKALAAYREPNPALVCLNDMFTVSSWASFPPSETRWAKWPTLREKMTGRLEKFLEFSTAFQQEMRVARWQEGEYAYLYLGNAESGIFVVDPERYLEYVPEEDFSDMTPAQVRGVLGAPRGAQETGLIPAAAESSMTQSGAADRLKSQCDALDALGKQMDDVKGAKTGELAVMKAKIEAMQAELESKKQALMADLEEKKAAMEEQKEKLEQQIYLLDSQIYCIRCYAGEVVRFAKILSGRKAPDTEPIVIHQKLRFLDEELGLLASLYEIQWGRIGMFEDFLKHSPLALDVFAPNQRCVTLVRLSRTAKKLGRDANPYSNMLEEYEYYHGRTVGIIVRNGENLYLGWTDEDRVHIEDDLLVGRVVTEIVPEPEQTGYVSKWDLERQEKERKAQRKKVLDGIISRSFIYNVLQGVVDRTSILPLPAGVSLNKPSEYVVYSLADKWLTDDRYGDFSEILARCNEKVTRGDMLLTVQHLVPEHYSSWGGSYNPDRAWENPRGRGEANRTHDCSVDDCTIYPANLVEYDEPVERAKYKWRPMKTDSWREGYETSAEEARRSAKAQGPELYVIEKIFTVQKRHVFVSVEKTECWNWEGYRSDARANFELYKNEYINLTYLNSVWLGWVITNKKLGGWKVGGKTVEYAHAIRYLKTAMDFIRKREEQEKALLDAVDPAICRVPEWQVRLSEWKMSAGVREITAYQAKRFAKAVRKENSK